MPVWIQAMRQNLLLGYIPHFSWSFFSPYVLQSPSSVNALDRQTKHYRIFMYHF